MVTAPIARANHIPPHHDVDRPLAVALEQSAPTVGGRCGPLDENSNLAFELVICQEMRVGALTLLMFPSVVGDDDPGSRQIGDRRADALRAMPMSTHTE